MLEVPCCQQFDPVHGGNRDVGCVPWLRPRNRVSIKQQISERFCIVAEKEKVSGTNGIVYGFFPAFRDGRSLLAQH